MKIEREATTELAGHQGKYPWARPGVIYWAIGSGITTYADTPAAAALSWRRQYADPSIRRWLSEHAPA